MGRGRLFAWLWVGFLVGLILAPTTALARPGGRGGGGRGHGGHGGHHRGGHHGHGFHNGGHKGFHNGGFGHGHKSFHNGGFGGHVNFFDNGFHHKGHHFKGHHLKGHRFSSCCAGVVYAPPVFYDPPTVSYVADYAPAPVYPVTYQVPVAAPAPVVGTGSVTLSPAPPSVVEYPHGRYELRGDGVTTAYQWVWIPNPPPAPPPAAPPPPAVTPPAAPPPASDAPRSRLYRWTDDLGVTHWTNRADNVPPEYRKLASPAAQP